jgi:hypothetical protein
MARRTGTRTLRTAVAALVGVALMAGAASLVAQERPALLFTEGWQQAESALGTPTSPHRSANPYYLAGQSAVANGSLEVGLYGEKAGDITVYEHEGRVDLWTGLAGSPVAVTLKHTGNYLDLTGLARVRAIVRTNNLHRLHPVVRLADGTLLVGSQTIDTGGAFLATEVAFDNQQWFLLDEGEVSVSNAVADPDLSRVDEVGFANLSPSGGHGDSGWANISTVEVYAAAVPRM